MIEPHGGTLVNRVVEGEHSESVRAEVADGPFISLSKRQYQDAINIATGRFSPLTGFMTRNDFLKVV